MGRAALRDEVSERGEKKKTRQIKKKRVQRHLTFFLLGEQKSARKA